MSLQNRVYVQHTPIVDGSVMMTAASVMLPSTTRGMTINGSERDAVNISGPSAMPSISITTVTSPLVSTGSNSTGVSKCAVKSPGAVD